MSRKVRCAIYTRKSSEDGLEQEFNSLDAQREACEAYIQSQKAEGWVALQTSYDDGGLSGGTLARPALQRLLSDLDAGLIDQIVVYKIDRLSRSLADFAKIVDRLDASEASFVSVTQSFNTATSMGRLTLNMLLSFAQFEREVTAERIRDKIAASKRKGLWMGGTVPLGYDPDGRSLQINESEAETVRKLFAWYLELGTLSAVLKKARTESLATKARQMPDGSLRGNMQFERGSLQYLLRNPVYIGKIRHKTRIYDGEHDPIITSELWQSVQELLASNAVRERGAKNKPAPSPLIGKIYDESGDRLTPTHTRKNGKRLRYYISSRLMAGNRKSHPDAWRLPAPGFETCIADLIKTRLSAPTAIVELLQDVEAADLVGLRKALTTHASAFRSTAPVESWADMVERIDIAPGRIRIALCRNHLAEILSVPPKRFIEEALVFEAAFQLRRKGVETKILIGGIEPQERDQTLVRNVAMALDCYDQLKTGASFAEIAKRHDTSTRRVQQVIPLAFLAPDLMRQILAGTHSPELTSDKLIKSGVAMGWAAQRRAYGSHSATCTDGIGT